MPAGPGFLQSGEDVGSGQGPSASLEFGQAAEMERLNAQLRNSQPQAYQQGGPPNPAAGRPGPAGPALGTATTGSTPVSPPVQPPPLTPADMRPGGPVFSQARLRPTYPWRQELRLWASHPDAGPFLARLRQRADNEQT
jgi:hypothetical protein